DALSIAVGSPRDSGCGWRCAEWIRNYGRSWPRQVSSAKPSQASNRAFVRVHIGALWETWHRARVCIARSITRLIHSSAKCDLFIDSIGSKQCTTNAQMAIVGGDARTNVYRLVQCHRHCMAQQISGESSWLMTARTSERDNKPFGKCSLLSNGMLTSTQHR